MEIVNIFCDCGCTAGEVVKTPNTVHYAKIICSNCSRFIKWKKAPQNIERRNGCPEPERVSERRGFENCFCFFCGRKKEQLGEHETLTVDHILKLEENGKDEYDNMRVFCTACHKLKHWTELYMRKHYEAGNK
jgi:5-methylcytosine-specific restriction endonuclease McrA